ncbi:hypothetical protein [Thalassotalea maritima]|uniref:hypothetical protein n=1 Tax=Thalassotalea maritima TaxID=3242416 RepID=UPI0035294338
MKFPHGSVGHTLTNMHGIWHDKVDCFELDGQPLKSDNLSGTPGQSPFENLVYIDFCEQTLKLTNVHLNGRKATAKTFTATLINGVLVFDSLGEGAYENIGMSGGPNIVTFNSRQLNQATDVYMEPDFIVLTSPTTRIRHTVLYRHGMAIRTLTAHGKKLSSQCLKRHPLDPRGTTGAVHEQPFKATIWQHLVT